MLSIQAVVDDPDGTWVFYLVLDDPEGTPQQAMASLRDGTWTSTRLVTRLETVFRAGDGRIWGIVDRRRGAQAVLVEIDPDTGAVGERLRSWDAGDGPLHVAAAPGAPRVFLAAQRGRRIVLATIAADGRRKRMALFCVAGRELRLRSAAFHPDAGLCVAVTARVHFMDSSWSFVEEYGGRVWVSCVEVPERFAPAAP